MRWWKNPDSGSPNRLLSRTLGKIAFVDNSFCGPMPSEGSFWFSSITLEIKAGKVGGCFLAEPFEPIKREQLLPLQRSECTLSLIAKDSTIIVNPMQVTKENSGKTLPWILPLNLRRDLESPKVIAIVVNLGGQDWTRIPSE